VNHRNVADTAHHAITDDRDPHDGVSLLVRFQRRHSRTARRLRRISPTRGAPEALDAVGESSRSGHTVVV
jgi:hypothetical protein